MFRRLTSRLIQLDLYTKPDCCLCDKLKFILNGISANTGIEIKLREIDITKDQNLMDQYEFTIPVLKHGETIISEGMINSVGIREALEKRNKDQ